MSSLKNVVENRDNRAGRLFDYFIQVVILFALVVFSLETLPDLTPNARRWLHIAEIGIVIVFTAEYILRIIVASDRWKFVKSFYGVIDLLAILPFYLALGIDLKLLRTLRFFKLLRALKMFRYIRAASRLKQAVLLAKEEIVLFFIMTLLMLFFSAAGIYHFEHEAQPDKFSSVFHSLWWAVATLTTVGYGDMFPITTGGRIFTFFILIIGLSVLAVPTGLLASAMGEVRLKNEKEIEKLREENEKMDELEI